MMQPTTRSMTPTEFCDELLCSIGGRKTPGGRRLLKGAGIYYQLTGLIGTALLSLVFLISLFLTIVIPSELGLEGVILLFVAAIGLTFFWLSLSFGNIVIFCVIPIFIFFILFIVVGIIFLKRNNKIIIIKRKCAYIDVLMYNTLYLMERFFVQFLP